MAFWSQNTLEPLRKFRFQVQFGDETMWYAKSVTQPSPDVSMSEHQLINHKIKYPGIVTWNDIDITIVDVPNRDDGLSRDPFLPTKGQELLDSLRANGYDPLPPSNGQDGIRKNQYNGEKDFVINKIAADGKTLETWNLKNPFIKSIKYGDLDYSSDELLEITITVAYDSATLT